MSETSPATTSAPAPVPTTGGVPASAGHPAEAPAELPVEPGYALWEIFALLVGIGLLVGAVWALVDRASGRLWFYWLAPLLVAAAGGLLLSLAVGFYVRVLRPEMRGRTRRA